MAAKVGTSVGGQADANATSIASSAKSTTTGNAILVFVKWEWDGTGTAGQLSSVTDTAGNTYTIDQQSTTDGTSPSGAIAYCMNATGNASNVITANFSQQATWRRIIAAEWSGLAASSPIDGTSTNSSGSGTAYSTGAITTTRSGLMFSGVGGFDTLTSPVAAGTPTGTIDSIGILNDTFVDYYISSTGQSITPGASATGSSQAWKMFGSAFKDFVASAIDPYYIDKIRSIAYEDGDFFGPREMLRAGAWF